MSLSKVFSWPIWSFINLEFFAADNFNFFASKIWIVFSVNCLDRGDLALWTNEISLDLAPSTSVLHLQICFLGWFYWLSLSSCNPLLTRTPLISDTWVSNLIICSSVEDIVFVLLFGLFSFSSSKSLLPTFWSSEWRVSILDIISLVTLAPSSSSLSPFTVFFLCLTWIYKLESLIAVAAFA